MTSQIPRLFSDSKTMTTLVIDTCKSFIKLTPVWKKKIGTRGLTQIKVNFNVFVIRS